MKNKFIVMMLLLIIMLTSCQKNSSEQNDNTTDGMNNIPDNLPNESISVRSIEELDQMRKMLLNTNEKQLNDYLISIEGGGAHDKEDIADFINLVDSIPYVKLIDGNISWISYTKGQSHDSGKEYEILYVAVKSSNDDWIRLEYVLSVSDISSEVNFQTSKLSQDSIVSEPITNSDKSVTVFSEVTEEHVSGIGNTTKWIANINGIYTNIVYYTATEKKVNINEMLNNAHISTISLK